MAQFEKAFRHKTVKHFKVGPFIFKDGILIIKADDEAEFTKKLASFESLWSGLHPSDKTNIRALKAVSNEESVEDGVRKASLAVRGPVATNDISDRPAGERLSAGAEQTKVGDGEGDPANPAPAVTPPKSPTLSAFRTV